MRYKKCSCKPLLNEGYRAISLKSSRNLPARRSKSQQHKTRRDVGVDQRKYLPKLNNAGAALKAPTIQGSSPGCGCSSVDRVLDSEAKGRGFDPRQPHHFLKLKPRADLQPVRVWLSSTSLIEFHPGTAHEHQTPTPHSRPLRCFYIRLVVPLTLRKDVGKTELLRSLRTKD